MENSTDKKKTPIIRDFLLEAYQISQGKKIKPKTEHVVAAIQRLIAITEKSSKLDGLMRKAYDEACKRRAANGLPNPPRPPSLEDAPK